MKVRQIILFFALVLGILAVTSVFLPKDGVKVGFHTYRLPKIQELVDFSAKEHDKNAIERMQQVEKELAIQTQEEAPIPEREKQFLDINANNPAKIYLPNNDLHYFDKLFEQMDSCRNRGEVIHIIHYGDSQIEADRITSYIRKALQAKFGGSGPGLLPAVQPIHSYTVRQSNSDNMERFHADGTINKLSEHNRYGALAQFATFNGKANIHIRTKLEKFNKFNYIRLFVGNTSDNFQATLHPESGKSETHTIEKKDAGASVLTWRTANNIKSFSIDLKGSGEIYAVSCDGASGIAVDNVPMRGSLGTFFTKLDPKLFGYMHRQLNTQLILLEFGGNAMPGVTGTKHLDEYNQLLEWQIKWIKKVYPDVPIVLIGPSDMGERIDGKIQTRKFLEENITKMKATAQRNGIAFWNMFEVMGGRNSMVDWVEQEPPLAMPDYTHLTNKGAEMIGKVFSESLLNYYEFYHLRDKSNE